MTQVFFIGDGSTREYDVTFPYLTETDVKIAVDGVDQSITWISPVRVQLVTAPASGAEVRLYRDTQIDEALVSFQDGAVLSAADLNLADTQLLYKQQELTTEAAAAQSTIDRTLRLPVGESTLSLPLAAERSLKYLAFDDAGNPIAASTALQVTTSLASGGVARAIQDKLLDVLDAADFGAIGDGVTDDTAALVKLLAAMQSSGKPGRIREGRYLIETGALEWTFSNTPAVASPGSPGPYLDTVGEVVLVAKVGSPDAAFLSIHNDPDAGSRYVHGGHIGSLTFEDTLGDVAPNRHGLELYGVEAMIFAPMFSANLRGDLVHVKQMGALLTGDAWHVSHNTFESLTAWPGVDGWALNNDALSQFFNFNHIGMIWRVANPTKPGLGAWRGAGAGNVCERMSVFGNTGWAVDWSTANSSTQVATMVNCHIDGSEYGIHVDGPQLVRLGSVRIVHRYMETGVQADATSGWPKTVLKVGGGGWSTQDVEAHFYNYFKEGFSTTNPDLPAGHDINDKIGVLTDLGNDTSVRDVKVKHRFGYVNPGVSIPEENYVVNYNANAAGVIVSVHDKPIIAGNNKGVLIARKSSGDATADYSSPVEFDSIQLDQGDNWDETTNEYVAPATGLYRLKASFHFDPDQGALIRVGFQRNGAAAPIREWRGPALGGATAGDTPGEGQTYSVEAIYPLNRGDRIGVLLYSGSPRELQGGTAGIASSNYFEAHLL